MITYKILKLNKEKRKEFRALLPFNFVTLLLEKYKTEAINAGLSKPKYSYSLIRKVASGERHNEEVLRDLIAISNDFQKFLTSRKKYRKNGNTIKNS